jgi:hypothetical protein
MLCCHVQGILRGRVQQKLWKPSGSWCAKKMVLHGLFHQIMRQQIQQRGKTRTEAPGSVNPRRIVHEWLTQYLSWTPVQPTDSPSHGDITSPTSAEAPTSQDISYSEDPPQNAVHPPIPCEGLSCNMTEAPRSFDSDSSKRLQCTLIAPSTPIALSFHGVSRLQANEQQGKRMRLENDTSSRYTVPCGTLPTSRTSPPSRPTPMCEYSSSTLSSHSYFASAVGEASARPFPSNHQRERTWPNCVGGEFPYYRCPVS